MNKISFFAIIQCFLLLSSNAQETGTFKDNRDGHEYKWVKIGEQVWMAENLAWKSQTKTLSYGDKYITEFGYLYDFKTAQKGCPPGWHLPTLGEWEHLFKTISANHEECKVNNNTWSNLGVYLKSENSWNNLFHTDKSSDKYKFSAKAGGWGDEQRNYSKGSDAFWWSSSAISNTYSWGLKLKDFNHDLTLEKLANLSFRNIRCIKGNDPVYYKPLAKLEPHLPLKKNNIRLTGLIENTGTKEIVKYGIKWKANSTDKYSEFTKNRNIKAGKRFKTKVGNINYGETYTYYSFAENENGRGESEKNMFIIYPKETFANFGENKNRYEYVKGQEKVTIKITAKDSTLLELPNHASLSNSQKVVDVGKTTDGKSYIEIESAIHIPEGFRLTSPFPIQSKQIPDSVSHYTSLEGYSKEEIRFFQDFISKLVKGKNYTLQYEIVEDLMSWIEQFITYDRTLSGDQTAITVLNRRTGTCKGYTNFSQLLIRCLGIPCRTLSCMIPPNCGWGFFQRGGRHAFIEIYYPGHGWISYDPQHSIHFIDPFHLVYQVGNEKYYELPDNLNYQFIDSENSLKMNVPATSLSDLKKKSKRKLQNIPGIYCADIQNKNHENPNYGFFAFLEIFETESGKKYTVIDNAITHILHSYNGITKFTYSNGTQKSIYPDGKREIYFETGEKYIDYPNKKITPY